MRACFCLLLLILVIAGCTTSVHNPCPLTEDAKLGRVITMDTVVELVQDFSFNVYIIRYTLPAGIYIPEFQDDRGIFYKAPSHITEVRGKKIRRLRGGLYLPKETGKYYSFPSLYVFFGKSPRLCGLPDEFIRAYGKIWGIAYRKSAPPAHVTD